MVIWRKALDLGCIIEGVKVRATARTGTDSGGPSAMSAQMRRLSPFCFVGTRRWMHPKSTIGIISSILLALFLHHQEAQADFRTGSVAYSKGDYDEAYFQWLPLANQGHAPSQLNLGLLLVRKLVDAKDGIGAIQWFERAADQNYAPAFYNLGILYRDGREVEIDKEKAAELFRGAADLGNSFGEFALGLAYLNGDGVKSDLVEGLTWLKLAAEHGNILAMYELGQLYETGKIVEKDIRVAMSLYRVAAKSEHADASYRLGMIHATGSDVPQDIILGLVWLSLAAEYDHQTAAAEAASLRRRMTIEQLQDAKSLRNSLLEGSPEIAVIPVTGLAPIVSEKD